MYHLGYCLLIFAFFVSLPDCFVTLLWPSGFILYSHGALYFMINTFTASTNAIYLVGSIFNANFSYFLCGNPFHMDQERALSDYCHDKKCVIIQHIIIRQM